MFLMYNTLEYCVLRLLYIPVCPSSPPIANATASVSESASGTGDVSAGKSKCLEQHILLLEHIVSFQLHIVPLIRPLFGGVDLVNCASLLLADMLHTVYVVLTVHMALIRFLINCPPSPIG